MKKKVWRAKKAAAARNTAPSPPQEVEQELWIATIPASLSAFVQQFLRLLPNTTMPAWLSAFVQQFLRLLPTPTMPAWLSAFVQRFRRVPVVAQEVPARTKQGKPERKRPRVCQANMYVAPRMSAAALARAQEPAARHLPPGPSITEHLEKDAQVVDPYEQEARHVDYLAIRPPSKSEWDICAVCYFEKSRKIPTKKEKLTKHFENNHLGGGAWERCIVCTAMFFTQHLKRHTQYCHPGIAVKENLGI